MSIKLLIVDDSSFFRRVICDSIADDREIDLVGEARNGQEAIDLVEKLKPDVVTMDVEMPVMGGVEAVRRIMRCCPTRILMMSTETGQGAPATLDALAAGAVDFIHKKSVLPGSRFAEQLCARIRGIFDHAGLTGRPPETKDIPAMAAGTDKDSRSGDGRSIQLLAIAASTGGPAALQRLLPFLTPDFPVPILIIQHMPAGFTQSFADRLDRLSKLAVHHARHGERLLAGHAYLAPGGQQLLVEETAQGLRACIRPATEEEIYHPSADTTLSSLATNLRRPVMAIILTGMGTDGCQGARMVKARGGRIWSQDKCSSVIYGMPQAVAEAGLSDGVYSLNELADKFSMKGHTWIS